MRKSPKDSANFTIQYFSGSKEMNRALVGRQVNNMCINEAFNGAEWIIETRNASHFQEIYQIVKSFLGRKEGKSFHIVSKPNPLPSRKIVC